VASRARIAVEQRAKTVLRREHALEGLPARLELCELFQRQTGKRVSELNLLLWLWLRLAPAKKQPGHHRSDNLLDFHTFILLLGKLTVLTLTCTLNRPTLPHK
jgi:hypothetical protein